MSTRQNKIAFVLIMAFVLTMGACGGADSQSEANLGKAPDFILERTDGTRMVLAEELKEKNVVLVFFATWCPACVAEVPQVNSFFSDKSETVSVTGINIQESPAKVQKFIDAKGIRYPIVLDPSGMVASLYKVRGIPTVIAINMDGDIIYKGHSIHEMASKTGF
ncbi:MAG: TlpA disulfide reductase family protein [Candidatus Aadella gelida]|nr:TlpA disulfide reductase family protein [Candidatus Aadella gelida]